MHRVRGLWEMIVHDNTDSAIGAEVKNVPA
jgi:hypothetical protein